MKVPNAVHAAHPWVISRVAPDFDLLDVWELPVAGGRDEFGRVLEVLLGGALDPAEVGWVPRALFAVREVLGRVFRWDAPGKRRPIPGSRDTSLAERLPEDLRGSAATPALKGAFAKSGFTPLYRTDDEWAAELSNDTVHGAVHLSWRDPGDGRHRAYLAVYVKPRGRLGTVYLTLIDPFRHRFVYPALIRHVGRVWRASGG